MSCSERVYVNGLFSTSFISYLSSSISFFSLKMISPPVWLVSVAITLPASSLRSNLKVLPSSTVPDITFLASIVVEPLASSFMNCIPSNTVLPTLYCFVTLRVPVPGSVTLTTTVYTVSSILMPSISPVAYNSSLADSLTVYSLVMLLT